MFTEIILYNFLSDNDVIYLHASIMAFMLINTEHILCILNISLRYSKLLYTHLWVPSPRNSWIQRVLRVLNGFRRVVRVGYVERNGRRSNKCSQLPSPGGSRARSRCWRSDGCSRRGCGGGGRVCAGVDWF